MGKLDLEHGPRLHNPLPTGGTRMETSDGTYSEDIGPWLLRAWLSVRIQPLFRGADVDYI